MINNLLVQKVCAAETISTSPIGGKVFEGMTIGSLFTLAVNLIIMIGLGLVLVFLALGFIKFITSQGDKIATEQAQKWVTYAVIGGVGLFAVFAVKSLILTLVDSSDPIDISNDTTGE